MAKNSPVTINETPAMTLEQRCRQLMPYIGVRGAPIACVENLEFLANELGVSIRYNVISKRDEIIIPNSNFSVDNASNAALAWITSKMKQIGMATDFRREFMSLIADNHQYNPVQNWITSKKWDGRTRLPDIYATIKAKNEYAKERFIFRWMIGAVAMACSPNGCDSSGILVLQGSQNMGKTWWFRKLVPENELPGVTRADATINPHDKDSVNQAISHWLVELGELDATFKKAEIAALKGFITREFDIFRRPYAADDSKFPRRTAFMASVNPWYFLTDETGNRRFWTIECLSVDSYHTIDMQQLWAEIYYKWQHGETWRLNKQEVEMLNEINEDHLAQDPLADLIMRKYDWDAHEAYWREMTATQVLEELQVRNISKADTRTAADTIKKISGLDSRRTGRARLMMVPPRRDL